MATIRDNLGALFEAERKARTLHAGLLAQGRTELVRELRDATKAASALDDEGESALRLARIALLLGNLEGDEVVDILVDILGSESPEARVAAGESLEALAFDRFKEVAVGIERALERLPKGSPALTELPFLLAEVGEPGCVKLLGRFLKHPDAEAVAAAIEALAELGDPAAIPLLAPLEKDARQVQLDEEEGEGERVAIGDLAHEARELLEDVAASASKSNEREAPREARALTVTATVTKGEIAMSPARRLGSADAAIFETFVVPRYLSLFAERLVGMIAAGADARVCHLQCRTGYPDELLFERLPNAHVYGCDTSEHAIELARAKARTLKNFVYDYRVVEGIAVPFPAGAFSHAFTLHPLAAPAERRQILEELARIVAPQGQALVAMPLRGSFVEVADLMRECALKNELTELTNAVEAAVQLRPTEDSFARELESVGFEFVEVDFRTRTLKFESGRDFFEDPVTRLMLLPEFRVNLDMADIDAPFAYARDAIDKYWSDGVFELTVNIGVASGRRKA